MAAQRSFWHQSMHITGLWWVVGVRAGVGGWRGADDHLRDQEGNRTETSPHWGPLRELGRDGGWRADGVEYGVGVSGKSCLGGGGQLLDHK